MDRIDVSLVPLKVVAIGEGLGDEAILVGYIENLIGGETRRLTRPQIGEDDSRVLLTGIRFKAGGVFVFPSIRLSRLIQTIAASIKEPAMVDAPQPPVLQTPIAQVGASMGAVEIQHAWMSLLVAEQDQLLA
jgi:hypothetical protein